MNLGYPAVRRLRGRLLAGTPTDWEVYHKLVADRISPKTAILDVGCGKGNICPFPWDEYQEKRLVGLDVDDAASQNRNLDRFVLLRDQSDYQDWPLQGETFDLVLGRYVLEHVKVPAEFLANVRRSLKPGGQFLFLTPHLFHPAILASRALPHFIKQTILRITKNADLADVFPTYYRMNTKRALRTQAESAGLRVKHLELGQHHPVGYLDFSIPTFWLAYSHYRILKRTKSESWFGSSITGIFERR
jgi:2-polyprenyl-3-methyl-5-hydroxy-6-metoxy-1,4-benzoquinol methylase